MKKYFIYTLSKNDVVFYVGITTNIRLRIKDHRVSYGDDIVLVVIDKYTGTLDTASALETTWIKKYRDLGVKLINLKQRKIVRNSRSYKTTDLVYRDAMERANREKTPLAKMIEEVVEAYGDGAFSVSFIKPPAN